MKDLKWYDKSKEAELIMTKRKWLKQKNNYYGSDSSQ